MDLPSIQISTEVVTFWMAPQGYGCTWGKEVDWRLLLKAWIIEGTVTSVKLLQAQVISMTNSTKHLKKATSILHNLFQKTEENKILPNWCYEASVSLISKPKCKKTVGQYFSLTQTPKSSTGAYLVVHGKESACNAGDPDSIPGLGRSPEVRNGNPLSYSCWRILWTEKPSRLQSMGVTKSWTRLSLTITTTKILNKILAYQIQL